MGITVLMIPPDFFIALMAPVAPWEWPKAPTRPTFNLFWNMPPGLVS